LTEEGLNNDIDNYWKGKGKEDVCKKKYLI